MADAPEKGSGCSGPGICVTEGRTEKMGGSVVWNREDWSRSPRNCLLEGCHMEEEFKPHLSSTGAC